MTYKMAMVDEAKMLLSISFIPLYNSCRHSVLKARVIGISVAISYFRRQLWRGSSPRSFSILRKLHRDYSKTEFFRWMRVAMCLDHAQMSLIPFETQTLWGFKWVYNLSRVPISKRRGTGSPVIKVRYRYGTVRSTLTVRTTVSISRW